MAEEIHEPEEMGERSSSSVTREALEAQLATMREDLQQTRQRLQASNEREAVLRGELQHRVRNMLAIIRSIFARTLSTGGSLDDIANHFDGRLDAVARYQSFQAAIAAEMVDFEQVVRDELYSFEFGDHRAITIEGDDTRVSRDMAQLAALAIHELVANSIKFGTLSEIDDRAHLLIEWTGDAGTLTFKWVETGVAVKELQPLRRGFGRKFIEEALPYQLGATSVFELKRDGLTCIMTIPLDAVPAPMI